MNKLYIILYSTYLLVKNLVLLAFFLKKFV
jgi:hypothetical protein